MTEQSAEHLLVSRRNIVMDNTWQEQQEDGRHLLFGASLHI